MKSFFGGSAMVATALLTAALAFYASPLAAETLPFNFSQDPQNQKPEVVSVRDRTEQTALPEEKAVEQPAAADEAEVPAAPATHYVATAYSLRGRTASGKPVAKGLIAADPRVLPLGSRVRIEAGNFSGEYLVADTGGKVRGKRIDIWTASTREAMRFGRRLVKLTVLSYGPKRAVRRIRR